MDAHNISHDRMQLNQFLTGVRILDLSHYIPGPMATLLLADMGAEVIKIEPPHGDGMRQLGPRDAQGEPIFFHALNAGKKSITLNLKEDKDRQSFLDMVAQADVVVEGFRPQVLERLKISYPELSKANPRIILCSISGHGAQGERALEAGHDANYLALSGIMDRNGVDAPSIFDPPISDVCGSLFAGMAILGALHGRDRTHQGCTIDIGLADTLMPLQLMHIAAYGANSIIPKRGDSYLNGAAAYYNVYATADGAHVVLGAVEPKFWNNFCQAAQKPEWVSRQLEAMPQHILKADIAKFFAQMSRAEIEKRFAHCDCCISTVLNLADALADPHIQQRSLLTRNEAHHLQALFPAYINGKPGGARPHVADMVEESR